MEQGMEGSCGGSGQEREPDASPSPVQPTRLFASGDTAVTGDPETLDGGHGRGDPHTDHSSTATLSVRTNIPEGEIRTNGGGSGGGGGNADANITTFLRSPDVELDCRFDGLRIEQEGGAAGEVKGEKHKQEQLDGPYHTIIEDLETSVKIEAFKRLDAESRIKNLEDEVHRLEDHCRSEIAAREAAESALKHYKCLYANAKAAWQKTIETLQNKEKELAATDSKEERSLQRRREDVRKGREMDKKQSASFKLAVEGGGPLSLDCPISLSSSHSLGSLHSLGSPSGNAAVRVTGANVADNESLAMTTPHWKSKHRMAEAEIILSPKAKLAIDRKAAAEERLKAAKAKARWMLLSKKITASILQEQMAQLDHVQHKQLDHAGRSQHRQKPATPNDSQLSPSGLSYFPSSTTVAALQKAREQQEPQQKPSSPAMLLLDLDWEQPSAAQALDDKGDGQIIFAAPSPATAPIAGGDLFAHPPLPPRPRASPATTDRRDAGNGNGGGDGGDGDEAGGEFGPDVSGSPVRLVLPLLSFSEGLPGNSSKMKRAEQPQTQPQQTTSTAFGVLEETSVSDEDESVQGLGPVVQAFASSSIDNAGNGTGANSAENHSGGKCDVDIHHDSSDIAAATTPITPGSYYGSGTPPKADETRKKAETATMPFGGGGNNECSGEEEKKDHAEINANDDTGTREENDAIVQKAGAFLQALENEWYSNTMATLEVDLGSAVKVMSEEEFLELHHTKVRTTEPRAIHSLTVFVGTVPLIDAYNNSNEK